MVPNELERLLSNLRSARYACPSLRLGQLLLNAVPPGKDLYYVSDAELNALLIRYINEVCQKEGPCRQG